MTGQHRSGAIAAVTLFAILLGYDGASWANPIRWFGLDGASSGMGGGQASLAAGMGTILSNPALLVDLPGGVWAGLLLTADKLEIRLKDRPGPSCDVDSSIYQSSVASVSTEGPLDRPLATEDLVNPRSDTAGVPSLYLFHLLANSSLGLKNFKLGVGIVTPIHPMQSFSTYYSDEREQFFSNRLHFERFGEFSGTQMILLTLAQRVSVLSFGLTLIVDMTAITESDLYIPEGSVQTYSYINAGIESRGRLRFVAALAAEPMKGLKLGLVLRQPTYLDVRGEGRLQLWNFDRYPQGEREIVQPYRLVMGYMPMELAGGASYSRTFWSVGATITWQRWSQYLDRHGDRPDPAFNDTVSFLLSGRFSYWTGQTLLAGFGFYPSPVPGQTGRTNYVDSHLIQASLGHVSSFPVGSRNIELSLFFQAWHLLEREVFKDESLVRDEYPDGSTDLRTGAPIPEAEGLQTNNPGFPGFTTGGWFFAGGVTLGFLL